MIFIDAHVHIYECFELELFFNSALKNFQQAAINSGAKQSSPLFMLLLAEGSSYSWYQQTVSRIKEKQNNIIQLGNWEISPTDDALSLYAQRIDTPGESLTLVAGRQIVSAEKIEILALFCNRIIPDGLPLAQTIDEINKYRGIPVIPWGAGKWLGKRRKILEELLSGIKLKEIFLGDNGGRPRFWGTPNLFHLAGEKNIPILPGSDPLPLVSEAERVGSFGFYSESPNFDDKSPAQNVMAMLSNQQRTLHPYGKQLQNIRFFNNQIQLRLSRLR